VRERRWIILADDGRHVTVGRHSDPCEDDIIRAGEALRAAGHGGWLAILEGVYYGDGPVTIMQVREIASPTTAWGAAVESFHALRGGIALPPRP